MAERIKLSFPDGIFVSKVISNKVGNRWIRASEIDAVIFCPDLDDRSGKYEYAIYADLYHGSKFVFATFCDREKVLDAESEARGYLNELLKKLNAET